MSRVILLTNVSVSNYALDQYVNEHENEGQLCPEVTQFKHISRYSYPMGLIGRRSILLSYHVNELI